MSETLKAEPMLSPDFVKAEIRSGVDTLVRHYLKRGFTVDEIVNVIVARMNSMDPYGRQVTE